MEILITALIILLAIYIIFKTLSKASKGSCNCGACSSSCPKYKKEEKKS